MRADNVGRNTEFRRLRPAFFLAFVLIALALTGCAGEGVEANVASDDPIVVYAPATPSSAPVILAAREMPNVELTIFTDHAQAQALFLRGDIDVLVTGLAVGVECFEDDVPVTLVNSYVSGLTYLATRDAAVESFADLRGAELYLPFEGSPIDEVTRFFVEREGLVWREEITPVYSPFPASVELLRQGKATAVALPEPFVSLVEGEEGIFVSLNYEERWEALTEDENGYPQVGTFVLRGWAAEHEVDIARFNAELEEAVALTREAPAEAANVAGEKLAFPPTVLLSALERTTFAPRCGAELELAVRDYYRTLGEPLDESFEAFFYGDAQ
jgi:NitT/TauT family transport system substrate-binding protein